MVIYIYYSDTDSIVTDIKLPEDMISSTEIGKLKLEHEVEKGIFISGKTYCLVTKTDKKDKKFVNKAKGVKSTSLNYYDYLNLLHNIDKEEAIKTQSKKNWLKGEVVISKDKVTVSSDSYTKQVKIYDVDKRWIDTKPIVINEIDKSVTVSKDIFSLSVILPLIINKQFRYKNLFTSIIILIVISILLLLVSLMFTSDEDRFYPNATEIEDRDSNKVEFKNKPLSKDNNNLSTNSALATNSTGFDDENNNSISCNIPSPYQIDEEKSYNKPSPIDSMDDLGLNRLFDEDNHNEVDLHMTIQANFENFYRNKFTEVYPNSEVTLLSQETLREVKQLLNNLESNETNEVITSPTGSDHSFTLSEREFERLVREIRSGSEVSIYSPVSEVSTQSSSLNSYTHPSSQTAWDNGESSSTVYRPVKPGVVIITRKVEEGESIPALPMWTNVDFEHKDYSKKIKRLDDIFNSDYISRHKDHMKPSDKNQRWMEENDTYDLDSLFKEDCSKSSSPLGT